MELPLSNTVWNPDLKDVLILKTIQDMLNNLLFNGVTNAPATFCLISLINLISFINLIMKVNISFITYDEGSILRMLKI
ncbi:hypothetical protein P8452_41755 [Trifolium repens]|nr:hypothetical protein P8452_41755 [Trifolium repens]